MTEHLNKRFKDILIAMGDPDVDTEDMVFHSIRHTSAGVKLRLSKGDVKAVQGDGGWNTPDMVTKQYAQILDEDRINLAKEMDTKFYQKTDKSGVENSQAPATASSSADVQQIASLLTQNPNLLIEVLQSVHLANNA